jgi:hypothetical protein
MNLALLEALRRLAAKRGLPSPDRVLAAQPAPRKLPWWIN